MEARFYIEAGQPKVMIDGEWNALSLFLESDSSFSEAVRHIELKKQRRWIGNTSVLHLVSGSKFEVSTELDLELKKILITIMIQPLRTILRVSCSRRFSR